MERFGSYIIPDPDDGERDVLWNVAHFYPTDWGPENILLTLASVRASGLTWVLFCQTRKLLHTGLIFLFICYFPCTSILRFVCALSSLPITVAARSKAWNVFSRSNIGIVGSNSTKGMDVCVRLFCVCVDNGLATGSSPSKKSYRLF
jgi:hypothetical protein